MAKVISMQSADKYAGQNATFVMFCYKSDKLQDALLEKWFIENLGNIANQNAKKTYAKSCCLNMSPEDNNCPFILSNLTFVHFSNFVMQRKACRGKSQGQL